MRPPKGWRVKPRPTGEAEKKKRKRKKPTQRAKGPKVRHYCCYLLTDVHGWCYIGSTCNPENRFRQHRGEVCNGAKRTKRMEDLQRVLIVSGFQDKTTALKFEWKWQKIIKYTTKYGLRQRLTQLYELLAFEKPWTSTCRFLPADHPPLTITWFMPRADRPTPPKGWKEPTPKMEVREREMNSIEEWMKDIYPNGYVY